ncbi:hypothetical protein CWB96_21500 [Pseudoalteromonas citrea]|uniref:SH3b domain-containing protein n=1 Tax=Pseudoalteromonas citrea TaxID=43655 RepID=A0A5S3XJZ6_9GAMM|nr:SH3 domain-containing protein [Pseudoalteromonas citrea]TMP42355.1 hypothetical protein CWB97_12070 [Pseudoalteromonas citrea]TMP52815.1 hypothetical protein CWB96_21500 [Pseudoalteromonas citrea]
MLHLLICSVLLVALSANAEAPWGEISTKSLIEIKSASGYLPAIVQINVNVRASPDRKAKKLGILEGGKSIRAEFLTGSEWARIEFKGFEAYVHQSALIAQSYKADINYSIKSNNSTVISMSGWHYSYLPGSYFLTYQSSLHGQASFGPISGSGLASIKSHFYKLHYVKRDVYLATSHESGNRTYYTPYLVIPTKKSLWVFQLPAFTKHDHNSLSVDGDTLIFKGQVYNSCCEYEQFDLAFNLSDFTYKYFKYAVNSSDSLDVDSAASRELELTFKNLPLRKNM